MNKILFQHSGDTKFDVLERENTEIRNLVANILFLI